MTMISQSTNNDIALTQDGQIALASGKFAYADILRSAVLTLVGELQLDTESGIPYLDTVFNNYGGIDQWRNAVWSAITSYDFVELITSFDTEVIGNKVEYKIIIQTDDGEVVVSNLKMI